MLGIFGTIKNPFETFGKTSYTGTVDSGSFGLIVFLNNILRLLFVIAGLYAFLNLVIAGLSFIDASGDSKKISSAWAKIWQSVVGLLIIVASFVLAGIFGMLLFGDATAILNPKLYTSP